MDIVNAFSLSAKKAATEHPDFLMEWSYQKQNRHIGDPSFKSDFGHPFNFEGVNDLCRFWDWGVSHNPPYFSAERLCHLEDWLVRFDKNIASKLGIIYDFNQQCYRHGIVRMSAQDYLFNNLYPDPYAQNGLRILDFGSGFGRQAASWKLFHPVDLTFISVDAIEKSYCTQFLYYSCFEGLFQDYVIDPEGFHLNDISKGLFHLPTWKIDLIPDNYLDKIIFCQVLPELSVSLIKYLLPKLCAKLKPGGTIYVRDHKTSWTPVHGFDSDKYLLEHGMHLEFSPILNDKHHIHGIPRIFRKDF